MVHWLRPCTPDTGGPGAIPGQGTGSHIPKLRAHMLQWRSLMPQLRSGAALAPPKKKFLHWNVTPSVMVSEEGLGRWLHHEGGVLMNVISALMRKRLQGTRTSFCCARTQQEDGHLWTKKQVCTPHWICWCLILDFLASRTKWQMSLFKPPNLWYSITAAWMD